jgi:NAD(P)-dependent dehydrogenase (short-subunit alcohol dehydrogenase family)
MQNVLMTGANRGIGLEFARQFAAAGWRVFACCRNPAAAAALTELRSRMQGAVSLHAVEVTDQASIAHLAAELKDQPLDVLINNAGVDGRNASAIGQTDTKVWLQTLAVNTIAPMHMAEAFLPNLMQGERKIIATVSSRMGSITELNGGSYAYRSSKAAVNAVMKGLSGDLGDRGVIVVSLHPGWVQTDMGGPSAPIKPADSVRNLLKVLTGLKPQDNGKFLNFDGGTIPW